MFRDKSSSRAHTLFLLVFWITVPKRLNIWFPVPCHIPATIWEPPVSQMEIEMPRKIKPVLPSDTKEWLLVMASEVRTLIKQKKGKTPDPDLIPSIRLGNGGKISIEQSYTLYRIF